jgi:hypothetical protein
MTHTMFYRAIPGGIATAVLTLSLLLGLPGKGIAADQPAEELTYARHVAPMIRAKVAARVMPPWYIDRTVGIKEFKNDRGLTDEQIEIVVGWIDGGAPFGDRADLPPPAEFPDPNRWQLADRFGEPDLIVRSEPYTLAAHTQDKWFRPVVETGLTEVRWVRAIEMKPSYPDGRRIVHHALAFLEQDEEGLTKLASTAEERGVMGADLFMEWAVGKVGEIFPPDAGKLMSPGARIRWEVHMHAVGQEVVDDVVELGLFFLSQGSCPEESDHAEVLRRTWPLGPRYPSWGDCGDPAISRIASTGSN